jgi:hypothetical protein
VLAVHLLVDVLPGRVGERQLRALLLGVKRIDRAVDQLVGAGVVLEDLADQDAADLARGVAVATRHGAIERLLGEKHAKLGLRRRTWLVAQTLLVDRADIE